MDRKRNGDRQIRWSASCISTNTSGEWGVSHWDRLTPFDDITIRWDRLVFGSPFEATVMHHSVKASRNSSKTKSDICCQDTYPVISNLHRLCREMILVLVITVSSSSSAYLPEPGKESAPCGSFSGPGISSFPCSSSVHSGSGSEALCYGMRQLVN